MIPTLDPEVLGQWVGRREKRLDVIDAGHARAMQATLDLEPSLQDGDVLPALWHWLYFLDHSRTAELATDGLADASPILPPIDLPNRMWAGARFEFSAPVIIGQMVEREREVISVNLKQGSSGPLCFVTLMDSFRADARLLFSEAHEIVYRTPPQKGASPKVEMPYLEETSETVVPGPILLFRYSALTFNSHRIHYDPDYCREEEGYPGALVHGPLTATLLCDFAERLCPKPISRFRLKATAPLFSGQPIRLAGRILEGRAHVWAVTSEGGLAMDAEADFLA